MRTVDLRDLARHLEALGVFGDARRPFEPFKLMLDDREIAVVMDPQAYADLAQRRSEGYAVMRAVFPEPHRVASMLHVVYRDGD